MKRRIARALSAAALACGALVATPIAVPHLASQAAACTLQYEVIKDATVRDAPGGNVRENAFPTDIFNADNADGAWVHGDLYFREGNGTLTYTATGWILRDALDYRRCF